MPNTLDAQAAKAALPANSGWVYDEPTKALQKTFKFPDFSKAFGFMTRCALAAEKMDHHPDWTNVYNTVSIRLSTHNAGGVTQKDIALAARIDANV